MSPDEVRPLACPRCARKYSLEERFCLDCGMPLVYVGRGEEQPITEAHERARKIKPQFTGGQQVRVASANNLAEAELIQGILLEEGIPSVQRRMRGFDVPDFLAAGPRDILVPEAGADAARDLLADVRPGGADPPAEVSGERPLRLLIGLLIALVGAAALVWLLFQATSASAAPILSTGPPPSLPAFQGSAVQAHPTLQVTNAPQNPFLAQNPNSNIHDDTWMTDAYHRFGPLGASLIAGSEAKPPALCGSLTFDSRGRIVTVCPSIVAPPQARIINPRTLQTIASYDLPTAPDPPGTKAYQNFTGGGYFFIDQHDRMWVPTKTDHIFVLGESANGTALVKQHDYDLTGVLDDSTERITSALPDFSGRIWFVSKKNGKVGTIDRATGQVHVKRLGEEIENSFAVGKAGVYIVSDKRMYRFEAAKNGAPRIVWQARYPNSGIVKPSQVDAGSGTTPTVMSGHYVAITDNADPMDVVVYRNAPNLKPGEPRMVCKIPVFKHGASATENSLLTAGRALIVENNYGYQDPFGPNSGAVTQPGFARVDVWRNGQGCEKVWENHDARAPTVVPKLSTKTGLIYTYTRPPDPSGSQGYYWTAISFHTGRTVWSQYAGSGLAYNNNYAGIAIGPNRTEYLGVTGGIITLRDG
jgi:Putative prokaryotic signal transducing protein